MNRTHAWQWKWLFALKRSPRACLKLFSLTLFTNHNRINPGWHQTEPLQTSPKLFSVPSWSVWSLSSLQVSLQVFGDLNGASKWKLETRSKLLAVIISPLSWGVSITVLQCSAASVADGDKVTEHGRTAEASRKKQVNACYSPEGGSRSAMRTFPSDSVACESVCLK